MRMSIRRKRKSGKIEGARSLQQTTQNELLGDICVAAQSLSSIRSYLIYSTITHYQLVLDRRPMNYAARDAELFTLIFKMVKHSDA